MQVPRLPGLALRVGGRRAGPAGGGAGEAAHAFAARFRLRPPASPARCQAPASGSAPSSPPRAGPGRCGPREITGLRRTTASLLLASLPWPNSRVVPSSSLRQTRRFPMTIPAACPASRRLECSQESSSLRAWSRGEERGAGKEGEFGGVWNLCARPPAYQKPLHGPSRRHWLLLAARMVGRARDAPWAAGSGAAAAASGACAWVESCYPGRRGPKGRTRSAPPARPVPGPVRVTGNSARCV